MIISTLKEFFKELSSSLPVIPKFASILPVTDQHDPHIVHKGPPYSRETLAKSVLLNALHDSSRFDLELQLDTCFRVANLSLNKPHLSFRERRRLEHCFEQYDSVLSTVRDGISMSDLGL
ncbi:hypothetical protein RCL1_006580 [Eukaryota sp. TZLM3-RCL]